MPPKNAGDTTKAYRLRRQLANGQQLKPIDQLWLDDYTERTERAKKGKVRSFGASAAGRKIKLDIEEHAESVGTGTAASEAASAALMVKEEGRRLDSLTINSVAALKEAVDTYKAICLSLKESTESLHATHIEMFQAWRGEAIARTETELQLREQIKNSDDDDMKGVLLAVVAQKLGIDLPGMAKGKAKAK